MSHCSQQLSAPVAQGVTLLPFVEMSPPTLSFRLHPMTANNFEQPPS